jgi:hypothetical protein
MRLVSMLLKVVVVLAAAWGCALMAGRLGPWKAMAIWAAVMGVLCAGIALAISRQSAGKITVLNYLMGYVLQWGYRIGKGKLSKIAMISWIIWMLVGTAAVLATRVHATTFAAGSGTEPQGRGTAVMVLLTLSWIIDGAALCYLLGVVATSGKHNRLLGSLGPVMGVLLLMIGGSAGLVLYNHSPAAAKIALLIAGGPVLLVGLLYGVFMVVIVVSGRKTRWN